MKTILEPCCKHKQFAQFLHELKKGISDNFCYYGDVTIQDWLTPIVLEMKGADVYIRLKELDLDTLNYLLNRMRDYAFVPGTSLTMLQHVTIVAKTTPSPLPQRAELLQQQGRLIIKTMKRSAKTEEITLNPCNDNKQVSQVNPLLNQRSIRLTGNFFADLPNQPRNVNVKIL